ncbi:MAG: neutral/alkaline non-lysosomal ceramidase N-terminal domain-containing protein [Planctomycetaceae bacterium]|nr:neutral/alkaline non-lysosomal ceramidase N-terminal domain-containing protein [Planctomycetaceae bacterium]
MPQYSRMCGALLLLALLSCSLPAAEFRAAATKADITPADLVALWGYSDRSGPATGTRDPLYAKVLLLDDGATRLAWVTLDLGRPFGGESMNLVRDRVRSSAEVTHVCFSASHTHSGPAIDETYEPGQRPAWETAALDRIAAAIESAAAGLQPARIGTGEGSVFIGHNRRYLQADGSVKMLWRNATRTPTHPLDPRVGVIRLDNADGHPLAVVVNYACHPVVFGPDNLEYSADFPGAMAEVVETSFGPDCVCLFLQGAPGDINPYYDKMKLEEGAETLMRETGRQLGDEALRVAKTIETVAPATPQIQIAFETRHFKPRYDSEQLLEQLRRQGVSDHYLERYRIYLATPMDCVVTTALINREIAIMGMPGEPFVEFGLNFRDRAPAKASYFAGYCNGYHGYFPTIRAAVEGGYGAVGITARTEVGAGEAMVDLAVIRLLTMQGLLKTEP